VKRYPKNKESADHSSYYLTAIAIIDRQIGPNQYTPGMWNDPKVLALIDKVKLEADPSLDSFGRAGISEIRTKQGNVYVKRVEYPAGDPKNPMTDRELEDKLRGMAEPYMTDKRIDRLIQTVYALDKLDNLDELMQCMTFDRKAS
jgi:2-methylcitrate dehydratase